MKGANNTYFGNIREGVVSSWQGLKLTLKHLWQARQSHQPISIADEKYFEQATGIVTLRYPYEALPIPDNGRYRLHNEMEDCIVCDKCADVCPVNCIDIEAVKSPEEIRKTSDGHSVRLYAARFDIDMAKCCFCGLCTTVCPTECLTMTKTYDFSEFDVRDMIYHFSDLSPTQATEKQHTYESFQLAKQQVKTSGSSSENQQNASATETPAPPTVKKPVMKPIVTMAANDTIVEQPPANNTAPDTRDQEPTLPKLVTKRPVIKPVIKKNPD